MVDINEIYKSNSDYLKAEDIGYNMWTVTITGAEVKNFDDGTRKLALSFADLEKILPLNTTNARAVADLYGHNSEGWIGQQIMLFTMPVDFQGKKVQAIRIRAPMQQQQPAQARQQAPQPRPASPQVQRPNGYAQQSGGTARTVNTPIDGPPKRELPPVEAYEDEIPF